MKLLCNIVQVQFDFFFFFKFLFIITKSHHSNITCYEYLNWILIDGKKLFTLNKRKTLIQHALNGISFSLAKVGFQRLACFKSLSLHRTRPEYSTTFNENEKFTKSVFDFPNSWQTIRLRISSMGLFPGNHFKIFQYLYRVDSSKSYHRILKTLKALKKFSSY